MGSLTKEVMEQHLRAAKIDLKGTVVIFRQGNGAGLSGLQKVSAHTASSIIILSLQGDGQTNADDADSQSLRILLALRGLRFGSDGKGHVVVEVADVDNSSVLAIMGGEAVELIVAHDFVSRVILQSSRQSGLSQVLSTVLGFDGNE